MAAEREPEQIDNPLRDALLRRAHRRPVLQDQRRDVLLADPLRRVPKEIMRDQLVDFQISADRPVGMPKRLTLHRQASVAVVDVAQPPEYEIIAFLSRVTGHS